MLESGDDYYGGRTVYENEPHAKEEEKVGYFIYKTLVKGKKASETCGSLRKWLHHYGKDETKWEAKDYGTREDYGNKNVTCKDTEGTFKHRKWNPINPELTMDNCIDDTTHMA